VVNGLEEGGYTTDPDDIFPAIERLRIPVEYLANLLAAGDCDVIRDVLKRLAALRRHMRHKEITHAAGGDEGLAASVGMTPTELEDLYRLLAIARYEDRYVIPQAHTEYAGRMVEQQGARGYDFGSGAGGCDMIPPQTLPKRPDNARFMLLQMAPRTGAGGVPDARHHGGTAGEKPSAAPSPRTPDDGT
jgi:nitrate reductase beta subunit